MVHMRGTGGVTMSDPHLSVQCTAQTRQGTRCMHWAATGDDKCYQHGGIKQGKKVPCRCSAYPWPHKARGGWCNYPNPPIICWRDDRKDRHRYPRHERRKMARFRLRYGI
jgi:hypothetical protein